MTQTKKRFGVLLAAAVAMGLSGVRAQAATPFFDWLAEADTDITSAGYVPTPTLSDATVNAVVAYFNAHPGQVHAVKIRDGATLSQSTINKVFGDFNVQYTFADYEANPSQASTLQSQIANSKKTSNGTQGFTSAGLQAGTNYISNFGFAPIPIGGDSSASGGRPINTSAQFTSSNMNMVSEALYPGDAGFKVPTQLGGNSSAPNIRSALFMLPLTRFNTAAANAGSLLHVPYISRFNAWNNPSFDTDATKPGVQFDTSKGGSATAQQLLSRDDFQAMVLHYRMRGASSFHLLDPGVVGYTQAQEQADAVAGWNQSAVAAIFNLPANTNPNVRGANTQGAMIAIDGSGFTQSIESAGVVYSAITADNGGTGNAAQLAVLISNLSPTSHAINLAGRINGAGFTKAQGTVAFTVGAGQHSLLVFNRSGTGATAFWQLNSSGQQSVFDDPLLASRDGVGIPEPTSISLLALGAVGVLVRRRRRN